MESQSNHTRAHMDMEWVTVYFGLHQSAVALLTSVQTNCTKKGTAPGLHSNGLNPAHVKTLLV